MDGKRYKEFRAEIKTERKLKFNQNYRVHLHFMSESLHSDYGTFNCDKCDGTFYHSPAVVYKGSDKKYSNCCGHCVNDIMDWNKLHYLSNRGTAFLYLIYIYIYIYIYMSYTYIYIDIHICIVYMYKKQICIYIYIYIYMDE